MFKGVGMAGTTQNATLDEKEGLALVTLCPIGQKVCSTPFKSSLTFSARCHK
jgi:hypothetical protein